MESDDWLVRRQSWHIRFRVMGGCSRPKTCFAIATAVCGSQPKDTASCICIKEKQMCLRRLMDCLALSLLTFLRIAKAMFGCQLLMVWTAFVSMRSSHLLQTRACWTHLSHQSSRTKTEACGSARGMV